MCESRSHDLSDSVHAIGSSRFVTTAESSSLARAHIARVIHSPASRQPRVKTYLDTLALERWTQQP